MNLLALDPLLSGDIDLTIVLIVLLKAGIAFTFLLISVMLMVWFERKLISDMQNRIGPDVAGPWGILQTLADGIKLFFKEDLIPDRADRFVFKLAPYLSLVPAFLVFAVVPIGGDFRNDDGGVVTW
ncbi:MAG: NADH-quinone oxidoreductase subunit H, partial [Acidimicrobiales bacterium]